jgi:hypothetical protein
MSGYTRQIGLWQFLPPDPAKWFWTRIKLYVAILVAVVAGFFFFAGWYAAPMDGEQSRVSFFFDWNRALDVLVLVRFVVAAGDIRRRLGDEHRRSAGSGKPREH